MLCFQLLLWGEGSGGAGRRILPLGHVAEPLGLVYHDDLLPHHNLPETALHQEVHLNTADSWLLVVDVFVLFVLLKFRSSFHVIYSGYSVYKYRSIILIFFSFLFSFCKFFIKIVIKTDCLITPY